jgi:hypothetical protein
MQTNFVCVFFFRALEILKVGYLQASILYLWGLFKSAKIVKTILNKAFKARKLFSENWII